MRLKSIPAILSIHPDHWPEKVAAANRPDASLEGFGALLLTSDEGRRVYLLLEINHEKFRLFMWQFTVF